MDSLVQSVRMHGSSMKRILLLFILTFLFQMCVRDLSEHMFLKQKQCQKQKNIVFLKTHKVKRTVTKIISLTSISFQCASSSIQNIFLRFGEKNDLNIVVPRMGHQLLGPVYGEHM